MTTETLRTTVAARRTGVVTWARVRPLVIHVVLAASARCFFSKTLDALGVRPDAHYRELPEDVREALVVGRAIAEA